MKKINPRKLLIAILICEGAGIIGSLVTIPSINSWYSSLNKPFFNPPSSIFGPVWTTLYFLMGISLYLAWIKKIKNLNFFWLQLGLNILWSYLFFGLHSPILGLVDIIALLVAITLTIKIFDETYPPAGLILIPYFLWVSFATILNFSIVFLNP